MSLKLSLRFQICKFYSLFPQRFIEWNDQMVSSLSWKSFRILKTSDLYCGGDTKPNTYSSAFRMRPLLCGSNNGPSFMKMSHRHEWSSNISTITTSWSTWWTTTFLWRTVCGRSSMTCLRSSIRRQNRSVITHHRNKLACWRTCLVKRQFKGSFHIYGFFKECHSKILMYLTEFLKLVCRCRLKREKHFFKLHCRVSAS